MSTPNPPTTAPAASAAPLPAKESAFFQPYAEFAKSLRTWFIAYGIGAPALLLTNKELWTAASKSGCARLVAVLFLAGVGIQIIEALLYKHAMWHFYAAELDPGHEQSGPYKLAERVTNSYRLEAFFDIATLALFAVATVIVLTVLA